MAQIAAHELTLNRYLTDELMKRYGDLGWFRIIGPQDAQREVEFFPSK